MAGGTVIFGLTMIQVQLIGGGVGLLLLVLLALLCRHSYQKKNSSLIEISSPPLPSVTSESRPSQMRQVRNPKRRNENGPSEGSSSGGSSGGGNGYIVVPKYVKYGGTPPTAARGQTYLNTPPVHYQHHHQAMNHQQQQRMNPDPSQVVYHTNQYSPHLRPSTPNAPPSSASSHGSSRRAPNHHYQQQQKRHSPPGHAFDHTRGTSRSVSPPQQKHQYYSPSPAVSAEDYIYSSEQRQYNYDKSFDYDRYENVQATVSGPFSEPEAFELHLGVDYNHHHQQQRHGEYQKRPSLAHSNDSAYESAVSGSSGSYSNSAATRPLIKNGGGGRSNSPVHSRNRKQSVSSESSSHSSSSLRSNEASSAEEMIGDGFSTSKLAIKALLHAQKTSLH